MKRFLVCLLVFAGCAAPPRVGEQKAAAPVAAPSHPWRQLIVFVPQTDDAAATWLKWFVKNPNLRMVIAMSPHFQRAAKDPHLKSQFQALQKEGRLELALQIPNAPILPLLVDSASAKDALPSGAALPTPSYTYPDDVIQLIARSKAGFFKQWNFLPRGLVLPFGAASPKLVSLLEKLGFSWVIGALNAPAFDGPYRSGPLFVWDATPSPQPSPSGRGRQSPGEGTVVRVWDERQIKGRPLEEWLLEMNAKNGRCLLPQDPGGNSSPLDPSVAWKSGTWVDADWSAWIGQPAKNSAWAALGRTREALEAYKNSGQASVQRMDAAFEEIYGAQNSNFFSSIGNGTLSPALVEEREHEFQATLLAVYRIIGKMPPDDLFAATTPGFVSSVRQSSTTARAENFPDGREHVLIEDAVGDSIVPGGPDLKSLDVWASTDSIHWIVTLTTAVPSVIDIYVDLNNQPNAGTPAFLAGRPYTTAPNDAWEYAISMAGSNATLYRTQGAGAYGVVQTFPVVVQGNASHVTIPRDILRGSPKRWGYQVLVMTGDAPSAAANATISDFIDPFEISQKDLWQDLTSSKRTDIPFVRIRNK